jgi:hypothetical protein
VSLQRGRQPVLPGRLSSDVCQLLHGPYRVGARLVMIAVLPGAGYGGVAGLSGRDPSTVRRWIRCLDRGTAGLADYPNLVSPPRQPTVTPTASRP